MDNARALIPQGNKANEDVMALGKVFYASGLFADVKAEAQAVVKILAGRELGFPPVQAMMGINIVMGKVDLSATLMAALVKRDGRYNYRVVTHTANECVIEFYEHGKLAYQSRFTIKDAEQAGLLGKDLWKKYPRNLLYARALTNGANIVCPERVSGLDVSDDLSADEGIPPTQTVTGYINGQQSQASANISEPPAGTEQAGAQPTTAAHAATITTPAATIQNGHPRPYTPEYLKERFIGLTAAQNTSPVKEGFKGLVAHWLDLLFAGQDSVEQKRHSLTKYLAGKLSTNDLTPAELRAFKAWLSPTELDGGAWRINGLAEQEAQAVITQTMLDAGQGTLPLEAEPAEASEEIPF